MTPILVAARGSVAAVQHQNQGMAVLARVVLLPAFPSLAVLAASTAGGNGVEPAPELL